MDPATTSSMINMTDQQFFLLLASCLLVVQVLYRIWDKKDNKQIIDAIGQANISSLEAIQKTIDGLAPHFERSRKVYGVIKELKSMHSVRDDDGRFIWYMPKEIIETQRELVKLTHMVATTQKHMLRVMERQEDALARHQEDIKNIIDTHQNNCKEQYRDLKDIIT